MRSFTGKMRARRIKWRFEGRSRDNVVGPPIFEIIPFVIVENALKYAPTGSEVLVKFEEKTDEILIRFDSLGPVIGDKEKNRIFERSYRGEAVRGSSLKIGRASCRESVCQYV